MKVTSFLIVCFMVSAVMINPALLPVGVLHQSYGFCGREMIGPQDLETGEACTNSVLRLRSGR